MREAREGSARNFLNECLVESDPAVRSAGRRTRIASVGASLAVQAATLTVLVIVPLFAAGKLPAMKFDAPMPIYPKGDPGAPPPVNQPPHTGGGTGIAKGPRVTPIQAPNEIPQHIATIDDRGSGAPHIPGEGPGVPWGDDRIGVPMIDAPIRQTPPPPSTSAAPRKPVPVSKGVMEARLIHRVQPCYPPLARQTRLSGTVQMRAIIATDGTVQALEVIGGQPLFYQCAINAVQQWRYQPTLLNDQPVEVETFITVNFILSR